MLDGEGGYTVWGRAIPASASLELGALPIGLAHRVALRRDIAKGDIVRWTDVVLNSEDALTVAAVEVRRAMETEHGRTQELRRN
jgi:predicted homoserine dehydrogenase-like protein